MSTRNPMPGNGESAVIMISQEACSPGRGYQMNWERITATDEDTALVARVLRGDNGAFDSLFLKYQDYVYHIVYGIVGTAEEARDLTQDVFVQAYRGLPRFRGNSKFATWLYRIAANRAVDAARGAKNARVTFVPETPQPSDNSNDENPQSLLEQGLRRDEVQELLMACPPNHRQVLALRYYRDLSVEELAQTLSCSVTAAKVRLHRARQVFRERYLARRCAESDERAETISASDMGTLRIAAREDGGNVK